MDIQVPNFKIVVNGTDLSHDLKPFVDSISYEDELNTPSMVSIKINAVDFNQGTWRGMDLDLIKPGDTVTVALGNDSLTNMITGEVIAFEGMFTQYSSFEIRVYDRLYQLQFGTKNRSFTEVKDSDIISTIASENQLSSDVDDTSTTYPYVYQNNCNDLDFITARACRIGYEIWADDKKLCFKKSRDCESSIVTLEFKKDIDTFKVNLGILTKGSTVIVRGFDVAQKEAIVGEATDGDESTIMEGSQSGFAFSKEAFCPSEITILDKDVLDSQDAKIIAKAQYNSLLKQFIQGEGSCSGLPSIRAGKVIKITGLGSKFSGLYYVVSSTHTLNHDGYMTHFKVCRTGI